MWHDSPPCEMHAVLSYDLSYRKGYVDSRALPVRCREEYICGHPSLYDTHCAYMYHVSCREITCGYRRPSVSDTHCVYATCLTGRGADI
jgi:hypothetical protein